MLTEFCPLFIRNSSSVVSVVVKKS